MPPLFDNTPNAFVSTAGDVPMPAINFSRLASIFNCAAFFQMAVLNGGVFIPRIISYLRGGFTNKSRRKRISASYPELSAGCQRTCQQKLLLRARTKGVMRDEGCPHGGSRLPARRFRLPRMEVFTSPNGGFEVPQRRFSLPPTGVSPQYGGSFSPVRGFDFPARS